MERLTATLTMKRDEVDRLRLQVLANAGVNLAAQQLPCHDVPAVWVDDRFAVPVVAHTGMPAATWGFLRGVATEVIVLPEEPGRR